MSTEMNLNAATFWDIAPPGQYANRRFGGTTTSILMNEKSAKQKT
jgi:hypothetical protein